MPSTLRIARPFAHAFCAASVALAALGTGPAAATPPVIYKCFDRNLAILYTDQPCSGELLEIRSGSADPEATAALQRERDALARSIEQRITDQRRAALEREATASNLYPIDGNDARYAGSEVYYPAYATGGYGRGRPPRMRPDHASRAPPPERGRYVPNPPRGLPR